MATSHFLQVRDGYTDSEIGFNRKKSKKLLDRLQDMWVEKDLPSCLIRIWKTIKKC
jgi:hypothetical protein